MVKIRYSRSDGFTEELDVAVGESVRDAAIEAGVTGIEGECGGQMNCATCHVYVDRTWLGKTPEIDEIEDAMLDGTACPREDNSRLSCQLRVQPDWEGFTVHLPESQY